MAEGLAKRYTNRCFHLSFWWYLIGISLARRTIPQAVRGNVPCLARRHCHGFAEGTVSRNSPPRPGSGRDRELSDCDGRRLPGVGEEYPGCEGVECGNRKYRGMAAVASRASSIREKRTEDVKSSELVSLASAGRKSKKESNARCSMPEPTTRWCPRPTPSSFMSD